MKNNYSNFKNRSKVKKEKKKKKSHKILYFTILFFIIIIVICSFFITKKDISDKSKSNYYTDTKYSLFKSGKNDLFYKLVFEVEDKNNTLNKIFLYNKKNNQSFEIPNDLYVKYDSKYYQLNNIINVIKQNRSESANVNVIAFIQDLIGVKIDSYLYYYGIKTDNFYTDSVTYAWQGVLDSDKHAQIINSEKYIIDNGKNIKIFDQDKSDEIIQKSNTSTDKRNIKIELYNSTDISGYGNQVARLLKNMGLSVVRVLNYDKVFPKSTLYSLKQSNSDSEYIRNILGIEQYNNTLPTDINTVADYIIILGGDTLVLF